MLSPRLRLCFVEQYLAILGSGYLDQHSHLHLPLALLKLHKKSDYKLKCRFCSPVGSDSTHQSLDLEKNPTKDFSELSWVFRCCWKMLSFLSMYRYASFHTSYDSVLGKHGLRGFKYLDYWMKFYLVFRIKLSIKPLNSNDPSFESSNYSWNQVTSFSLKSFLVRNRGVGQENFISCCDFQLGLRRSFSVCF